MVEVMEVRSIVGPLGLEGDRVKGSRFIGDAAPVSDEASAMAFIAAMRAREPSASHHCWAFRLVGGGTAGEGRERCSDDGEPGGTAGPPILRRITGADLHDVVVVVTRYFGGTKLGMGGLVRAYGGCAAAVLDAADILVRPVLARLEFAYPYDLSGPVDGVLAAHDAIVEGVDYAAAVSARVALPVSRANAFIADLTEVTAGRVIARPSTGPAPTD